MPPRLATREFAPQEAPAPAPAPRLSAQALADAVSARVGAARFNLWFAGHARFVPLGGSVVVESVFQVSSAGTGDARRSIAEGLLHKGALAPSVTPLVARRPPLSLRWVRPM